jgi:hypothetical protein
MQRITMPGELGIDVRRPGRGILDVGVVTAPTAMMRDHEIPNHRFARKAIQRRLLELDA